jgi:hypothetical protein
VREIPQSDNLGYQKHHIAVVTKRMDLVETGLLFDTSIEADHGTVVSPKYTYPKQLAITENDSRYDYWKLESGERHPHTCSIQKSPGVENVHDHFPSCSTQ